MSGRAATRLRLFCRALLRAPWRLAQKPEAPASVLVAHHLLLGDTLMLAALFAALRARWPRARLLTTCPPAFLPLFAAHPWGVEALAYDPRRPETLAPLLAQCADGVDLAMLPGDNRFSLLARACDARWIAAFAGDTPGWKNRLCDELLPWPETPQALADIFAGLAGAVPSPYAAGDWPAPPRPEALSLPAGRYALLHLGAGNVLRRWPPEHWRALAQAFAENGVTPVWSCGPGEQALVSAADPEGKFPAFAGSLDLAGLWHLVAGAALVVCPDSGVAHLAKLAARPTVCLFGQGSDVLFGRGEFFANVPFVSLIERDVPCRDQRTLFGRTLPWVRRCARRPGECADPVCLHPLTPDRVYAACSRLLEEFPGVAVQS